MILIYDGECEFCRNCVQWIQSRLQLKAIPFQEADLAQFLLSEAEAASSVHLILDNRALSGADAVAYLLILTRFKILGALIHGARPLSEVAYKWIASHRNSRTVRVLNRMIRRSVAQAKR
ncbi:unannotated protein [freshwater metagenome]|uniref:Unannotated protein n=1 Tax=freshwater metagenome TaxID=449393 RepID=A0A6J6R1I2_9ZZZZ|nr:DUF393 domain-containing protein [Actinomycetota bacterium]MTB15088.1 DUF393 domain-containing protein [Actinomycetota bacterium]